MFEIERNKKIEVILNSVNSSYDAVSQFPLDVGPIPANIKIQHMVGILYKSYEKTKKEMKNMFTLQEAGLIVDALNGLFYNLELDEKETLFKEVRDSIDYFSMDKKHGVNPETLLTKIRNLTTFQSFCVIRQAFEVWDFDEDTEEIEYSKWEERVKEIFKIQ